MLLNAKEADSFIWSIAAEAYTECEGSRIGFLRRVKSKMNAKGVDPATILLWFQIAMMIYRWAKENGFLSSLPTEKPMSAPMFVEDDDA